MIEQFISQAVQQIGAPQSDIEQGVGGLLSVLKQQADGSDFDSLLAGLPGADSLLNQFGDAGAASGLSSNLMGALGGMLGGDTAGNLAGIAGLLSQLNLDAGQLGSLASLFVDFAKENLSEDLVNRLMGGLGDFLNQAA